MAEYLVTWVIVILALSNVITEAVAIPALLVSGSLPWAVPWAIARRASGTRPHG